MERPRFPSTNMLDTLRQAAQPLLRIDRATIANGMVNLTLTLTKNEVTLVEIQPIRDETPTYPGLDDSLVTSYQ